MSKNSKSSNSSSIIPPAYPLCSSDGLGLNPKFSTIRSQILSMDSPLNVNRVHSTATHDEVMVSRPKSRMISGAGTLISLVRTGETSRVGVDFSVTVVNGTGIIEPPATNSMEVWPPINNNGVRRGTRQCNRRKESSGLLRSLFHSSVEMQSWAVEAHSVGPASLFPESSKPHSGPDPIGPAFLFPESSRPYSGPGSVGPAFLYTESSRPYSGPGLGP
ncbi:hypothetical protein CRG98_045627 [Punica granatum]|uniref:Uncharacterized protein n=1 Tax=Punica granatum TaxID=22663 RepID=A0A2I0HQM6_PUNGR|nr:hypothetical protein CRG98_045627 [Punica granatum]